MKRIVDYLLNAAAKNRDSINSRNLFRNIGFDSNNPRLGWVNAPSWDKVNKALNECLEIIGNKKEFVFIGMGGSINGVKTVISLGLQTNVHSVKGLPFNRIHCLDSLDPAAFSNVLSQLKDLKKTMIIPISKSGVTKETQLLAGLFKAARSECSELFLVAC